MKIRSFNTYVQDDERHQPPDEYDEIQEDLGNWEQAAGEVLGSREEDEFNFPNQEETSTEEAICGNESTDGLGASNEVDRDEITRDANTLNQDELSQTAEHKQEMQKYLKEYIANYNINVENLPFVVEILTSKYMERAYEIDDERLLVFHCGDEDGVMIVFAETYSFEKYQEKRSWVCFNS